MDLLALGDAESRTINLVRVLCVSCMCMFSKCYVCVLCVCYVCMYAVCTVCVCCVYCMCFVCLACVCCVYVFVYVCMWGGGVCDPLPSSSCFLHLSALISLLTSFSGRLSLSGSKESNQQLQLHKPTKRKNIFAIVSVKILGLLHTLILVTLTSQAMSNAHNKETEVTFSNSTG